MCIICIDLVRGRIRSKEAIDNMLERINEFDEKHVERIIELAREQREEEEEEGYDEETSPVFPRT
tara:strand:- start:2357 stop:2551 length:195 start_codon:yes stop_codon:yes gene_type:complete